MTTTSDTVAKSLAESGVTTVFGVVGTSTMDLVDAIAREPGLEFVSARTEEGAAHMADGYARATGRVGVVLCHVGPGALRQLYGVGTAWKDSVPLLALTGNEMLAMTDAPVREAYHVVDVLELYRPVSKATLQLRDGGEARAVMARALWLATAGRPGPVLVDLPKDMLKQPGDVPTAPAAAQPQDRVPASRPCAGSDEVRTTADAVRGARHPLVLAGGGVLASGAAEALTALAVQANLPVVTTDGGRGSVPEDHPLFLGVAARQAGDAVARDVLSRADVVLALGTPFSDVSTYEWSAWQPECQVVQVDITPEVAHKGASATRTLIADAATFCEALARELGPGFSCARDWAGPRAALAEERAHHLRGGDGSGEGVDPRLVVAALSAHLPRDAIVSVDSGMHAFFGSKLRVLEPRTYLASAGFGAMGYSFPAVLGALEGRPDRRGLVIVGDGCMTMCLGELETAARRRAPVTVVVLNDAAFASQMNHQRRRFDGRTIGTRFGRTDFAQVAEAQGVAGWTVAAAAQTEQTIAAALTDDGPNVLDVLVDPTVTPPTWIEGSGDLRTRPTVETASP